MEENEKPSETANEWVSTVEYILESAKVAGKMREAMRNFGRSSGEYYLGIVDVGVPPDVARAMTLDFVLAVFLAKHNGHL